MSCSPVSYIVRIPAIKERKKESHCGLPKNDAADELARRGILESNLLIQRAVPLAMESARSIIRPTAQTNILRVPSLPDELTISDRCAEVVLHQLMANCSPLVADFHHASSGDDAVPYNPACTACPHGAKETVERLILRSDGRAASRRKCVGRVGDKTVEELCERSPWRYSDS